MNKFITFLFSIIWFFNYGQFFENVAPAMGITHSVNTELLFGGHGVSFYDFDNDGWDDITFIQEEDSVLLYKNFNGNFVKIPSFAFQFGEIRQALWVDYDNDADNDLFVTATNGLAKLYRNDGNFSFTDVSMQAGLSELPANNYGISFADYNRDGFLDFYLTRYQMSGGEENPLHTNALYRNNGDGTFEDVTSFAGVADSIQPSFMAIWIDINKDLYPDLYVINDRVLWGNSLYLNNGNGTFTDYTSESGLSMFGEDPMGTTFGDYDNDGDIDILLSNGGPPTKPVRLYTNNDDSTFVENAAAMNIEVPDTFMCTWGGSWIDADNDSFLDLYITTGFLLQAIGEVRNYFFMNNQGISFTDSTTIFSGDHVAASYSVAKGDIDNDGYADLVVQNAKNFNSFIWKNNFGPISGNNYLKVTLEGTVSNKMAIGSWIKLYCDNQVFTHYTRCGESFISQDSQHHIFGLANYSQVDSLVIEYPSGIINRFYDIPVNQHLYLVEELLVNEISANNTAICQGDTIWIDGGDFSTHLWSNGWTQRFIPITESGSYSVIVTSSQGFQIQSNSIDINVLTPPVITHSVTHLSCYDSNDGSVILEVNTDAVSPTISWSNGEIGNSIYYLEPGFFSYNYVDEAGCSDTDTIEINNPSELIVFTNTSYDQNTSSYQLEIIVFGGTYPYTYFLDTAPIGSLETGIQPGSYILKIIDNNGCVDEQEIIFDALFMDNVNTLDEENWYPNPSSTGTFHFRNENAFNVIEVIDSKGTKVNYQVIGTSLTLNSKQGAYFILYTHNGTRKIGKLIIH